MLPEWADRTAEQIFGRGLVQTGIYLILGGVDTGKTTLAAALAKHAASSGRVGIIDADIGQSHIGPPATVGWAIVEAPRTIERVFGDGDDPEADFSQLTAGGISFVGDVTPTGHLLQMTAAITQCVQQVSRVAELIIIDTPGFIFGPAAAALWGAVQRILQPEMVLAVQRGSELSDVLAGFEYLDLKIERIKTPRQIPAKSPQERRNYRQSQFNKYFRDCCLYNISLGDVAVVPSSNLSCKGLVNRLVALRDGKGTDIAVGLITDWQVGPKGSKERLAGQGEKGVAVVRAPEADIRQVRCLVMGDITIEIGGEGCLPCKENAK